MTHAAEKMAYSKKRTVQSLDDIIVLFIHYIWKDLIHVIQLDDQDTVLNLPIAEAYNCLTLRDAHKLKKFMVLLLFKSVDIVAIIWRASNGMFAFGARGVLLVHTETIETPYKSHVVTCTETTEHYGKRTNKQNTLLILTMVITCLQYASFKTHQKVQLATTSYIEIEYSGSNQLEQKKIDTLLLDISGSHFMQSPEIHCPGVGEDNGKEHTVANENLFSITNQTEDLIPLNMTISNITATDTGMQLSAENTLLTNHIVFWSIFVSIVTLTYTAPITETVRKASSKTVGVVKSLVVELSGSPNTGYCANMVFGNQQEFCMLVDTGSSNLAVAAKALPGAKDYVTLQIGDTSLVNINKHVSVMYTGGEWSGTLASGLVSIGGSPPVQSSFALINSASNFFISGAQWSGILGLAYDSLSKPDSSVEPFWGVLQQTSGLQDKFAISICPHINFANQGGIMEFGNISDSLYRGAILYTSVVKELYYNVLVTNLTVGENQVDLQCSQFNNDKAIVDSGTTDIYLPSAVFKAVIQILKKHFKENIPLEVPESFWNGGSKLTWPTDSKQIIFEAFPTLHIGFAVDQDPNSEFSLAVPAQVYLRQVSGSKKEKETTDCLPECDFFVFGIKQRDKGMVIGGNVMLGFTTIFDRQQRRVGFAKSICNYADNTPGHTPYITGPYPRDPTDCECHRCSIDLAYWEWIVYTCGAVVLIISILSAGYTIVNKCHKYRSRICPVCCFSYREYMLSNRDDFGTENTSTSDEVSEERIRFVSPRERSSDTCTEQHNSLSESIVCEEERIDPEVSFSQEEQSSSVRDNYTSPSIGFQDVAPLKIPSKPTTFLPDSKFSLQFCQSYK